MTTLVDESYKAVTIKSIEEEGKSYESEKKYIIGVLLSIKVVEKQNVINQYNKKKLGIATYNRILTFGSCKDEEGKSFCMIFESSISFRYFIYKMMDLKIGDTVVIYEPKKIMNYLSKGKDLPVIESRMLAFSHQVDRGLYLTEEVALSIPEEGYTKFFFYSGVKIKFFNAQIVPVVCQGLMCDKQKENQCGCLMGHKTPRIVLDVNVKLKEKKISEVNKMNILSWDLTKKLFTDIGRDVSITSFLDMRKLKVIRSSINNIGNIINEKGGWTIIGWVRTGFTDDEVTTDSLEKIVGAESVSPHIISLSYTKKLDNATEKLVAKEKFSMTKFTTEALMTGTNPITSMESGEEETSGKFLKKIF